MTNLERIKNEVNTQLGDTETLKSLIDTTFKGLSEVMVKRAIMEGMMRGFTFQNFLEKDVYAVPFKDQYSLVTSIDYARKQGMRSGVVGVSEPVFEEKDGKIISCKITVKRKVNEYIGDYTAKVYFDEYNTGYNLWKTKPRTMIAKVAEMHALRKACPEELAKAYVEEEYQRETEGVKFEVGQYQEKLEAVKTLDELKTVWSSLPAQAKVELSELKDKLKANFEKKVEPKKSKEDKELDEAVEAIDFEGGSNENK